MTIRRTIPSLYVVRLLAGAACLLLNDKTCLAQADKKMNALQIIPPEVPRYRRIRPVFKVEADRLSKPLVPKTMIPAPPSQDVVPLPPPPSGPTKEELEKRRARFRENEIRETAAAIRHERLVNVGKALGFLVVVGVGAAALADIARQFRRAKHTARMREETGDSEWEP